MAVAIAVRFRLSADRRFQVTSLDVLVIFIAVVVPNLPGSVVAPQALGVGIFKLVVLFYALETLSAGIREPAWRLPTLGVGAFLVACVMRGMV
jgi:hypothetical protein